MDKSKFRFKTSIRVRNYEVDWQGIVHNANYLLYFEVGRVEYLKHLRIAVDLSTIRNESRVVLVRNEIDYRSPARFDQLLDVYTRVSYVRNTSFAFEGIIEDAAAGTLIAENLGVHVWLHPSSGEPAPVNDRFKQIITEFEGDHLIVVNRALKSR